MTVHMDAGALRDSASEQLRAGGGLYSYRAVPADFAEVAGRMGVWGLKDHYRTGTSTVMRWYRETGLQPRTVPSRYSPPADLAEQAPLFCNAALAQKYGVSEALMRNWLKISGLRPAPRGGHPNKRPVPEGFAAIAVNHTMPELQSRYNASDGIIRRWCSELGIRWHTRNWRRPGGQPQPAVPQVDASLAAQAAQFLRRHRIVYRCDILEPHERAKLPDKGKGYWYVNGRGAVPEAQMIEIAESKGFDARAWSRL
jgi:hypothetical protein